jgi:3-dehydroshikimate dehydratase
MNCFLCTISFRHELAGFGELIRFARDTGYQGIELWGVHARSMAQASRQHAESLVEDLYASGLTINMISDYLKVADADGTPEAIRQAEAADEEELERKLKEWLQLGLLYRTRHIRVFAGNKGSAAASLEYKNRCCRLLKRAAEGLMQEDMVLVIETHPDTLADTLESTEWLLEKVDMPNMRINLDILHLWESGTPPLEAYNALQGDVYHLHLKNITAASYLPVFKPHNVYSPFGTRQGIVALGGGAISYKPLLRHLSEISVRHGLSMEWFGERPFQYLKEEREWVRELERMPALDGAVEL